MTDALWQEVTLLVDSCREIEGLLGVARSTLSGSMTDRCIGFFMDLCEEFLLTVRRKVTSGKTTRGLREVLAIDSTEIDAHESLFDLPTLA